MEDNEDQFPVKKYVAELFGTFVLVLIGCGSAVIAGDQIGFLGISLAFGLAVLAMVYAIGPISGCHINPAISIAMLIAGKLNKRDTIVYIISQIIGAIIAGGVLYLIASGLDGYDIGVNGLGQNFFGQETTNAVDMITGAEYEITTGYTLIAAFLAEVVLTFIFLMVIFGSTSEKAPKGFAGISIGLSLAFIHMVGIPITGVSVNPARSIGPALFVGSDALNELWLFLIAPVIGAAIAAVLWKYVFEEKVKEEEEEEELPPRRRDHHSHREHHSRRPVGRYR